MRDLILRLKSDTTKKHKWLTCVAQFASYYLNRTYFFDVHPPFGKLLFAFAGWLVGYKGEFLFENIGDSYITNKVPYVAYRSFPALQGTLTVSTVFWIMWESGYSLPASILAAALLLFDNAHIGQTRLILLDATLVLFMALSILAYIRFYKLRHDPFSRKWWKWLLLTGVCLSCVISTKYVGVFTFFSIGVPVAIDLWDLLDVNRRQGALSLPEFGESNHHKLLDPLSQLIYNRQASGSEDHRSHCSAFLVLPLLVPSPLRGTFPFRSWRRLYEPRISRDAFGQHHDRSSRAN